MKRQYEDRDIKMLDKKGGYYIRHVEAMTAEKLHSKSAIAAELGWRDARIAELEAKIADIDDRVADLLLSI